MDIMVGLQDIIIVKKHDLIGYDLIHNFFAKLDNNRDD